MTHTPTPEEFLAQTEPDEADLPDPLESIADSLRNVVSLLEEAKHEHESDSAEERLRTDYGELEDAYRKLEEQLDEVLAICKPSTSKLANSIRAVFEPSVVEETPAPGPVDAGPPADDAGVEEWAIYAESLGHEVPGSMNRSQIRTLLGIPQPVPASGEEASR